MRYVPINCEKFSASKYLDEIKTDKFNSKDKLRDPTLIRVEEFKDYLGLG